MICTDAPRGYIVQCVYAPRFMIHDKPLRTIIIEMILLYSYTFNEGVCNVLQIWNFPIVMLVITYCLVFNLIFPIA